MKQLALYFLLAFVTINSSCSKNKEEKYYFGDADLGQAWFSWGDYIKKDVVLLPIVKAEFESKDKFKNGGFGVVTFLPIRKYKGVTFEFFNDGLKGKLKIMIEPSDIPECRKDPLSKGHFNVNALVKEIPLNWGGWKKISIEFKEFENKDIRCGKKEKWNPYAFSLIDTNAPCDKLDFKFLYTNQKAKKHIFKIRDMYLYKTK